MSLTAIGFIGVFVLLVVLAFLRHPVWGLYGYLWVFYNHPPARWWGSELPDLRLSLIAAIVTAVAMMLHHRADDARDQVRR
jgi:hypothetical protein